MDTYISCQSAVNSFHNQQDSWDAGNSYVWELSACFRDMDDDWHYCVCVGEADTRQSIVTKDALFWLLSSYSTSLHSVIFVNKNEKENGEKPENNKFVNEN